MGCVFPRQYRVDNPQKNRQKYTPPPATVWNCWGGCFLHGYITFYVSYYHFSFVVPYYDTVAVLGVDTLLSCPFHIPCYQVIYISVQGLISFCFPVRFYYCFLAFGYIKYTSVIIFFCVLIIILLFVKISHFCILLHTLSQVYKKPIHTLSQVSIYTMSQVCYTIVTR